MKLPEKEGLEHLVMLTSSLVWTDKITRPDLKAWLENFRGEVYKVDYEQHLALWLLANFVYYNQSEVRHLCRLLYREYLHCRLVSRRRLGRSVDQYLRAIREDTRFHYLGRSSESGAYILYYFRKENSLSILDFVDNNLKVGPRVKNVVLVDDVTLSGDQAQQYITEVKDHFQDKNIYVLTTIASTEAVKYLASKNVTAIAAITLDQQHQCFGPKSSVFFEYPEHKKKCLKMALHYGKKIEPKKPLGHNDCQYSFGFFYNTPDNALPIFWSSRAGWVPIVRRYPKNYEETTFEDLGRFV